MGNRIDLGAMTVLIGLSSAMLQGCGPSDTGGANGDWAVCTDQAGRRIPDSQCQSGGGGYAGGGHGGWVFINNGQRAPAVGEHVSGGSAAPSTGTHYASAPAEGIARGGFGATGEGHGGGEGGHGGAGE